MRIGRFHREELEHAHAERKDVRGHRRRRVLALDKLGSVPSNGGCVGEDVYGRLTDDLGEDLGESKVGEGDDALGRGEQGLGGTRDGDAVFLPLRKPTYWSVQCWTISVEEPPQEGGADLRISLRGIVISG